MELYYVGDNISVGEYIKNIQLGMCIYYNIYITLEYVFKCNKIFENRKLQVKEP